MTNKIIIGSRGSQLSLAYASFVKKKFYLEGKIRNFKFKLKQLKQQETYFLKKRCLKLGEKNFFCKEIEEQLIKKIDIAVHSLKTWKLMKIKSLLLDHISNEMIHVTHTYLVPKLNFLN